LHVETCLHSQFLLTSNPTGTFNQGGTTGRFLHRWSLRKAGPAGSPCLHGERQFVLPTHWVGVSSVHSPRTCFWPPRRHSRLVTIGLYRVTSLIGWRRSSKGRCFFSTSSDLPPFFGRGGCRRNPEVLHEWLFFPHVDVEELRPLVAVYSRAPSWIISSVAVRYGNLSLFPLVRSIQWPVGWGCFVHHPLPSAQAVFYASTVLGLLRSFVSGAHQMNLPPLFHRSGFGLTQALMGFLSLFLPA